MLQLAYKYRLTPTKDQEKYLNQTFGACRKVYNVMLDKSIKEYEAYKLDKSLLKPNISGYGFTSYLPILKNESDYNWLYNYSSCALQQKLLDLGKAFTNFFRDIKTKRKTGYPKFKSRYGENSFRLTPMYFKLVDNKLFIAKLSTAIKVNLHRQLPSEPSQITISRTPSGGYYVSFLCEATPHITNGSDVIGVDIGIKDLIVTSDGEILSNPKHYIKKQDKLRLYQRRLSRKVKGSNNRNLSRLKVARLHQTISNLRYDTLHKLSRSLVNRSKTIVIEDLNIKGMSKNSRFSKHILDSGFGMFRKMLEYKTINSNWCNLIIANRWYPSTQICSNCNNKSSIKIEINIRKWTCDNCNTTHDRDINASMNLANITTLSYMDGLLNKMFGKVVIARPYES